MATRDLWRIKPIDLILKQSDDAEHGLKRTLTAFSITLLGIGAIVGTGIFVLTGVAAAKYAGPGLILSFIVAGIVSGLAAICYAEFASTVPIAGSAYTYSYATLGELIAWIIGVILARIIVTRITGRTRGNSLLQFLYVQQNLIVHRVSPPFCH